MTLGPADLLKLKEYVDNGLPLRREEMTAVIDDCLKLHGGIAQSVSAPAADVTADLGNAEGRPGLRGNQGAAPAADGGSNPPSSTTIAGYTRMDGAAVFKVAFAAAMDPTDEMKGRVQHYMSAAATEYAPFLNVEADELSRLSYIIFKARFDDYALSDAMVSHIGAATVEGILLGFSLGFVSCLEAMSRAEASDGLPALFQVPEDALPEGLLNDPQ